MKKNTNNDNSKWDHPQHYGGKDNPFEHIKVQRAMNWNYCIGNATKYLWRAGKKLDSIEDMKKAIWYIQEEIKRQQEDKDNCSKNKE